MIYDGHTHLTNENIKELTLIGSLVHILSSSPDDWNELADLADSPNRVVSIAVHPWHVHDCDENTLEKLNSLLTTHPQVQLGETGLDYSVEKPDKELQQYLFREQLRLAIELNRVVTIHTVAAWGDTLDVIREEGIPQRGAVIHGFRGSSEIVRELSRSNIFFSVGADQVLNCGRKQKSAIIEIPADRLLLESDGRGRLMEAAVCLSEIRSTTPEKLISDANTVFTTLFS